MNFESFITGDFQLPPDMSLINEPFNSNMFSLDPLYGPIPMWSFICVMIAAFLIPISFMPLVVSYLRTKNTSTTTHTYWLITIIGFLHLCTFYGMLMIRETQSIYTIDGAIATHHFAQLQFCFVFACEFVSLLICVTLYALKLRNIRKAKRIGSTEADYCHHLEQEMHSSNSKPTVKKVFEKYENNI